MSDVADRHWGTSQVSAPTAKDAAGAGRPGVARPPATLPIQPSTGPPRRATPLGIVPQTAPQASVASVPPPPGVPNPTAPRPIQTARATPPPLRPIRAAGPAPSASDLAPAPTPAQPVVKMATAPVAPERTVGPGPTVAPEPAASSADQALARLARGVQDCARALESLADRLDDLEARLDDVAPVPPIEPGDGGRRGVARPAAHSLESRIGALEGLSADRYQSLDLRIRRLEAIPAALERLQSDTALLVDVSRSRRSDPHADLEPVYQELDSVSELVSAHHAVASQSMERVRVLERAVLEMRRHVERGLADQERVARSEQFTARARLDAMEARLRAAGAPAEISPA